MTQHLWDVEMPDVTGYELEEAKRILTRAGGESLFVVGTAAPVRKKLPAPIAGNPALSRVLRQKPLDGKKIVELTICCFEQAADTDFYTAPL